ncbi:hypothetical protein GLAREA_09530 [Glarea lozoyensis ATCC 20868]|uniref:Uncharacterized protein n=1 Tax=Glarea lozoyensis (strain ATCC 20868 / MF5171) TaxID=1116229 RepID=S3CRW1_GLAL2|nr:uncharacterized protein GLAREA_09530 [Glarea lozoyensis ATCC 20868]EPE28410.1 hypothetical protein GLAREA_09530 [Glarea lozoyensis ATCC 20868]
MSEKQLTNVSAPLIPSSTINTLPSVIVSGSSASSATDTGKNDSVVIVMGILAAITALCITVVIGLCVYSALKLFLVKRSQPETSNSGGVVLPARPRFPPQSIIMNTADTQQCQCRLSLSTRHNTRSPRNFEPSRSIHSDEFQRYALLYEQSKPELEQNCFVVLDSGCCHSNWVSRSIAQKCGAEISDIEPLPFHTISNETFWAKEEVRLWIRDRNDVPITQGRSLIFFILPLNSDCEVIIGKDDMIKQASKKRMVLGTRFGKATDKPKTSADKKLNKNDKAAKHHEEARRAVETASSSAKPKDQKSKDSGKKR